MACWILIILLIIIFALEEFFHINIPGIVYAILFGPLIYFLLKDVIKDAIIEAKNENTYSIDDIHDRLEKIEEKLDDIERNTSS